MKGEILSRKTRALPEVRAARDAFDRVREVHSDQIADLVVADLMADLLVDRFTVSNNLTAWSAKHLCPRALARGRCRGGAECPWRHGRLASEFDHIAGFSSVADRLPAVLVAHNYIDEWSGAVSESVTSCAAECGLDVRVSPYSFYYPTRTVQIELWHPRFRRGPIGGAA